MDRLRSPGGCPWDAAQTHESLARYLVEETYEVLEAIETGDSVLLREELGDLLLQVLFHARIAQEAAGGFGIDDVANDLVDKLVRRHPHVFVPDGSRPTDLAGLDDAWERGKAQEKGRTSAVDGIPAAQPALAWTAKLVSRARRAGVDLVAADAVTSAAALPALSGVADGDTSPVGADGPVADEDEIGRRLLAVVAEAVGAGIDPETALRRTARAYRAAVVSAQTAS